MNVERRDLLRSLAVLGGVGSAGCFGGDTGTPETDPGGNGGSPTESPGETPTRTSTPDRTPTYTTVCGVCTDPPDLVVDATAPEATAGATVTVGATFRNPYPFEVEDVEVALDAPTEEWTITPAAVTFETVSAETGRDVSWDVTVPADAAGEYTLTTVTSMRGPQTDYTVRTNHVDLQVAES